ncbi:MAG: DUF1116 domain-containing protein [bacterium]|nr:DUF1116 domain-containing protein [bacterium]
MVSSTTSPIDAANEQALERIFASRPFLTGIRPAAEVMPELDTHTILHAGPPLDWQAMCGPLRGAVLGVLQYEGWAADEQAGLSLIEAGKITFRPCHSAGAVGPMTGLITQSMPLMVVENRAYGNRAYTTLNEGLGKVLRFGANDASVIERLHGLQAIVGPALDAAVQRADGVDLRVLMAQALLMGDEMHQRNVAATSLFARTLLPHVVRVIDDAERLASLTDYLTGNDQFFLNLAMAAAKVSMDAASHIPACTLVTAMARNGTTFGIRVSGLGERWFTAPVLMPRGLYFPGFSAADANPDIGDSAIIETLGLGAFAMAASPAVAQFVGVGGLSQARRYTEEMEEITLGHSPHLLLPSMDGQGVPTGIDIRQVIETGIVPWINTGIAHRQAGIGQIGAGVAQAPLDCFVNALEAFAELWQG